MAGAVQIELTTSARSQVVDITERVQAALERVGDRRDGAALVYCPHTTAAVFVNENADPDVAADVLAHLERLVPWEGAWRHAEGNAAAHVRASLLGPSVWVPVEGGRLKLGRWQGIFFCEFDGPRRRSVWVQLLAPAPPGAPTGTGLRPA